MTRAALFALLLAYWACVALVSLSLFGVMAFAILFLFTWWLPFGLSILVCVGAVIGFAVLGSVAHWCVTR